MLASVAEQANLSLAWSETPEDRFCRVVAHVYYIDVYDYWDMTYLSCLLFWHMLHSS